MEEACLPVSDPILSRSSELYTFSNKYLCVVHNQSLYVYKSTENKWYCTSCTGVCPERKVVIDYQGTFDTHLQNHEYHPMLFRTVTTEPIPHTLSEDMRSVYRTQISQSLNLPEQLRCSSHTCKNGFTFNLGCPIMNSQKGLIIYTESDVISLPDHKGN